MQNKSKKSIQSVRSVYLDNAATTPVDRNVVLEMLKVSSKIYGNPSSLHKKGVEAKEVLDSSRQKVAGFLGCRSEEIYFTSGGTESCNMAILGYARAFASENTKKTKHKKPWHIVSTGIEHHAVLEPLHNLEKEGFSVTYLKADKLGRISCDKIVSSIRPETVLLSVMHANNETGTVQPIKELGAILVKVNRERRTKGLHPIVLHTDACQSVGFLNIKVNELNVDLLSLNGSKVYGPKGVGALYVRTGLKVQPIIWGGGQERNLRSGTENVPAVAGLAKALEKITSYKKKNTEENIFTMAKNLSNQILTSCKSAFLNGEGFTEGSSYGDKYPMSHNVSYATGINKATRGGLLKHNLRRLPNIVNLCFPGIDGEMLMLYLDAKGVCVSTGSACSTSDTSPSHVLKSMGLSDRDAKSCIRISLGRHTTQKEMDYATKVITDTVKFLYASKSG